jgi:hypothetical protein
MATASGNPSNGLDERLFPLIQVLERPVSERPQHETLKGIMDWLAGPTQQVGVPSLIGEFDEFAWRMLATGFPLLRATLQLRSLHPHNILAQTSFGGGRPVGPSRTTSRMRCRICMATHPLGRHVLRGLATPHELYAPVLPPSARTHSQKGNRKL